MPDAASKFRERDVLLLEAVTLVPATMSLYHFGSSARPDSPEYADIDLLLLYHKQDLHLAHEVATAIRNLTPFGLLDVIAISDTELVEYNLIASERATPLTVAQTKVSPL